MSSSLFLASTPALFSHQSHSFSCGKGVLSPISPLTSRSSSHQREFRRCHFVISSSLNMKPRPGSDNSEPFNLAGIGSTLPGAGGTGGLSAADKAGLVSMIQNKLDALSGQSSGYIESLPKRVRRRVLALQKIQSEHDDLEEKFFEEKAALEAKYQKLYAPLYDKRSEIVNGVVEAEAPAEGEEEAVGPDASKEEGEDVVGIPEFWLTAMKTNEIVSEQITERDEGALKHLKDIRCATLDERKGFRLDFFFTPNTYFSNEVLSKTYHMLDLEDPILERAEGTEINWLPGKNLTQKILKKKPKKGAKATKPVTKTEQCESFFNFFSPPQVPGENEDIDEESAQNLQDLMEQDYDIGSALKDKIIPHAVAWFTGEALEDEYDDGDDDGDEDDEEFDEEDEDEDEDDDEPPARRPAASGKQGKKGGGEGEGEQPPECKQQ